MWTRGGIQRFGNDGSYTYHFVLQDGDGRYERPGPVTIRPPTGSVIARRGYDVGQGCFLFVDLHSHKSPKDMLRLRLWIQLVVVRVGLQKSRYLLVSNNLATSATICGEVPNCVTKSSRLLASLLPSLPIISIPSWNSASGVIEQTIVVWLIRSDSIHKLMYQ